MTNSVATNFNVEGKGTKKGFIHYKISNIIRGELDILMHNLFICMCVISALSPENT